MSKYRIGAHICYDVNKDLMYGYPKGYLIEATSLEEAEKTSATWAEGEANTLPDGFVHDSWAVLEENGH